jgi:DNA repair protein RecO (recombination protein O)
LASISHGQSHDLRYVSPKSGRAVSADAGEPFRERLFVLPAFLIESRDALVHGDDTKAGLRLTGHFLLERVLALHQRQIPAARLRLDALAARESA